MLSLTKKTEYSLIALFYMLERRALVPTIGGGGTPISAREISDKYSLPLPLLMNILKQLTVTEVLISTRGAKGGYYVNVDPAKFSLAELIEALEGPISLTDCSCLGTGKLPDAEDAGVRCRVYPSCPVRGRLVLVQQHMNKLLSTITLADLCSVQNKNEDHLAERLHKAGTSLVPANLQSGKKCSHHDDHVVGLTSSVAGK